MFTRSVVGALISGAVISTGAVAGEVIKYKALHNNVVTKWESSEMGDEPGHIRGTFELKGIGVRLAGPNEPPYKVDCWGVGDYRKDGTGSDRGYCKFTFSDGSYFYGEWSGKLANGHDVGSGTFYGGSGRFKGLKGIETFDAKLMGDRSPTEVEGTIELP